MEFDKNLILYGPPGTGKTYYTILYAVAICDEKNLDEIEALPYEQVLKRYQELKAKEKRIAFTTLIRNECHSRWNGISRVKEKMF